MKYRATDRVGRPRTLIHPGPFDPVRIHSQRAPEGRHIRLALMPCESLFDALVRPLANIGITSASTTILGGAFTTFQYCVAPPDPLHRAVIAYGAPIETGATDMIFGNATLGRGMKGQPLIHCHATFRTEGGAIKGGHIITERCIVGPDPIPVLVTSLDGFELRQAFDRETNIALLQPFKENAHG